MANQDDQKTYKKSGLTKVMHGNIYQLKILMLMLRRALNANMSFELATEWVEAEDFNDLIFLRQEDQHAIYLQAKHFHDDKKFITGTDFKNSTEGNFSLIKYFNSYCKIKKNSVNLKIDFVIATNIDIKDALKSNFELVEDEIIDKMLVKTKIYKPKLEGGFFNNVIVRTELAELASKLAQKIIENKTNKKKKIERRNKTFDRFRWFLCTFIFDCEEKSNVAKFKKDFKNDTYKDESLKLFRRLLDAELKTTSDRSTSIYDVKEFRVSQTFTLLVDPPNKVKEIKPSAELNEEDVLNFLRSLRIAITPNENEFRDLICDELANGFGDYHVSNIYSRYLEHMLDWFKAKNGYFLTHQSESKFFDDICEEISEGILEEFWKTKKVKDIKIWDKVFMRMKFSER